MKPDKFLLGTLWIVSLLLAAGFWFDTQFGFDILARAHWRYLANIQTGQHAVNQMFYISLAVFALILPLGLYIVTKPAKRIKIENPLPRVVQHAVTAPPEYAPQPQRPPQLIIPVHLQKQPSYSPPPTYNSQPIQPSTPPPPSRQPVMNNEPAPWRTSSPQAVSAVRDIISGAGYHLQKAPVIDGVRINVWAVGSDEVLIMGLIANVQGPVTAAEGDDSNWRDAAGEFKSPVQALAKSVNRAHKLFSETLDESVKIKVKAFVVLDGPGSVANADAVRAVWNAFGIEVFDSIDALYGFMQQNRNRPLSEDETEDFEAYAEYIDTAGGFFGD